MHVGGLPLHPFVIHAAVVLIPMAATLALVWMLRRPWGWVLRWPTLVTSILAAGALMVSRMSGDALAETVKRSAALDRHEQMANLLTVSFLVMTASTVVAFLAMEHRAPWPEGPHRDARWGAVGTVARWVTVLAAIASLVFVVLTGHAGAQAVWTN